MFLKICVQVKNPGLPCLKMQNLAGKHVESDLIQPTSSDASQVI